MIMTERRSGPVHSPLCLLLLRQLEAETRPIWRELSESGWQYAAGSIESPRGYTYIDIIFVT